MNDAETWRWIWLAAAVVLVCGEMLTPGAFVMLPFAIGAAAAFLVAIANGNLAVQLVVFVLVSGAAVVGFYPLRRRLDASGSSAKVGATRLAGAAGVVTADIPPGADGGGMVRIEREDWRAVSADGGGIPRGAAVTVVDVRGTRVLVRPIPRDARPDRGGS
jgi:membrane protein implicated in regulation of membrane protease activity